MTAIACVPLATACLSGGGGSSPSGDGDGDGDVTGDGDVGDGDFAGDGDAPAPASPVAQCRQGCSLAAGCDLEGFDQADCSASCEDAYQDALEEGCGPQWSNMVSCSVENYECEGATVCDPPLEVLVDCLVGE